jgi:single-stranded-DNA-specific exonuclease
VDIIITDHHAISDTIPRAVAVVNPRRKDCASGADYLAGVGVAFCLVISLRKRLRDMNFWKNIPEPNLKACCDLVALGTIADVVPLVRENRVLAKAGLNVIATCPRPGIAALIDASGANKTTIDAEDIAFKLSPRLNAAGRMDHARLAVELLTAKDSDTAFAIAAQLNKMNAQRQAVEQKIFNQILMFLNDTPEQLRKSVLILGKHDWHEGVLGIVASKLAEKFFRPVILVSFDKNTGKGSGRSIPGIDLHDALCRCASYLDGFGGHPMAAGLSIKRENFTRFQEVFEKTVSTMTEDHKPAPRITIDTRLDFDMISDALVDEITSLAPFGPENPEPLFCAEHVDVAFSKLMGGKHRRLKLRQRRSNSQNTLNAVWFNVEGENADLHHFNLLVFKLKWNHWNGKKSVQAIIEHA